MPTKIGKFNPNPNYKTCKKFVTLPLDENPRPIKGKPSFAFVDLYTNAASAGHQTSSSEKKTSCCRDMKKAQPFTID
jgi:hypothetical protein